MAEATGRELGAPIEQVVVDQVEVGHADEQQSSRECQQTLQNVRDRGVLNTKRVRTRNIWCRGRDQDLKHNFKKYFEFIKNRCQS